MMLKAEMQHQYWITKKAVQRKFGSKEDEHITSSDAELDSKIEIFKSISATSVELCKIIEQYQERLFVLSQEESIFGRFLKESGKRSKTTKESITSAGKAVSYCGQQRMFARVPLLRLQHEVDVFRFRAITDMQNTITIMEKERTEYRAALEWMKSTSIELDPDTGRGLNKFRTAQSHVRNAKLLFDSLTMDSIQKIDLLVAARCNMFSHVLVSYMSELGQFAQKTNSGFETISKALEEKPKYDFCVLKELSQREGNHGNVNYFKPSFDKDKSFFAEDYVDDESKLSDHTLKQFSLETTGDISSQACNNFEGIMELYDNQNECIEDEIEKNVAGSEKLGDMLSNILNNKDVISSDFKPILPTLSLIGHITESKSQYSGNEATMKSSTVTRNENTKIDKNVKSKRWIDLFSDLDPLANLEAFDLRLSGANKNSQQI